MRNALNDEDVRPVADRVTVQSAKIVDYKIIASLYLYPSPKVSRCSVQQKQSCRRISARSTGSGVISANQPFIPSTSRGVQRHAELAAPVADIVLDETQASWCSEYSDYRGQRDEWPPDCCLRASPLEVWRRAPALEISKNTLFPGQFLSSTTPLANLRRGWRGRFPLTGGMRSWPRTRKREASARRGLFMRTKARLVQCGRVVEPLGYLINVTEWWETSDPPGTFRLDIGVLETGITEEMYWRKWSGLLLMQSQPAAILSASHYLRTSLAVPLHWRPEL